MSSISQRQAKTGDIYLLSIQQHGINCLWVFWWVVRARVLMKTAPLHFKINYLSIEQQELINDGNTFVMEIYVLVTQSRAMDMLRWGGEISTKK